jgi:fatty-acid peroxygenase
MTDLGIRMLRHGYHAVERDRAARGGGDTYVSRLLGRRTVVMGDPESAQAFYDESLARRAGAVPALLARLLFGRGAVHGLDGTAHRDRKRMFLDVLEPPALDPLVDDVARRLERRAATWGGREVDLHRELAETYGGAVLPWAGIELLPARADALSRRLAEIVDGFGLSATAYARGWRARRVTERWARRLVTEVRQGRRAAPRGSALDRIAGSDLDVLTAAVELLNVLRPTVAVSWLGAFAARAVASSAPEERARLADPAAMHERYAFAQEVRRTSPFVPALTARAARDAVVHGVRVRRGDRLVLDVVGIDTHPGRWPEPEEFRPARFLEDPARVPTAFDLVPQGGGHPSGHRCPGESLSLRLLGETVRVLAGLDVEIGAGAVDATRMPTLPAGSGAVRIGRSGVRLA